MSQPENIRPAYTLEPGTRIKLAGAELTVREIARDREWVTLYFNQDRWDPYTEKWTRRFGCHFGFCIEVL